VRTHEDHVPGLPVMVSEHSTLRPGLSVADVGVGVPLHVAKLDAAIEPLAPGTTRLVGTAKAVPQVAAR
jgi:hypothetical protein